MDIVIENFTEADLEAVDFVLRLAYKTKHPFRSPLQRYLDVQPGGSFLAKRNGRVMGFGASVDYGLFSYVGLMATHPDVQHQGVGRMVLEKILNWLDERKCPTVLLDATPAGAPLYRQFDFEDEDSTVVFERRKVESENNYHSENTSLLSEAEMPQLGSFDSPIFGAQRKLLLRSYWNDDSNRFIVSHDSIGRIDGYLVAQSRTVGPWIASSESVAERLLSRTLEFSFEEGPFVSVSGSNVDALRLLGRFGFEWQRSLRHMYRGKRVQRARRTKIYGQASLGFG